MKPLYLFLVAYLLTQVVKKFLFFINLRHLARHGNAIPAGFAGLIDEATLANMRDYTVSRGRLGLLSSLAGIAMTLVFLFGGLLDLYNSWLVGFGWSPMFTGLGFFLILLVVETGLKIPEDLYQTFVIEEKFGFNKQTPKLWLADFIKSLLVSLILTGLLLAAIFWLIGALPGHWWLAVWFFLFLFSIFMMYLSPYVIEPLFNKFTPVDDPALEERIKQTMERAGLSVSRLFAMDASKRSGHSNAYFTGIGHVKRIVLFDTLLANHDQDEIIAILAHEAGHWKKKHLLKMLVLSQVILLAGLYGAFLLIENGLPGRYFELSDPILAANLLLAGFMGSLLLFPLQPLGSLISRIHERQADRFAGELTGDAGPLAKALIKLSLDNLANLHPHPWYAAWHYSHPPIVERLKSLSRLEKEGRSHL